ncbi:MAG TPA: sugar phosphate isomerase/epimerase [Verrucomicrobiae bacterium]|nr:sugar phosphate isomerase/epimerase [Verrucomicrobiae bacterium]
MKNTINRRRFLQTGLLGTTALAAALPRETFAAVTKPQRDPFDGLKLGMASYTLRKFPLDQAIAMTKQAGLKYINLKDVHLSLKSSRAERQEARQKIEAAVLTLMGGGVIYLKNNDEEIRAVFDYAKDAGMPAIVCSPEPDALDSVEKMAKEYNILIAIHNHGPGDKKYPSPLDVLRLVKDRDPRMGLCMDVGHTVRLGEDPVAEIEQAGNRLHDFHIKDETKAAANGSPTEVGKGVIDIVGVLKALVAAKFPYHIGLEYEANENNPMPGVIESVAYMRGVLAAIG